MKHLILALTLLWPLTAQASPEFWRNVWPDTDFSKSSVEWIEILSGGPPKDGIPALNDPAMIPVSQKSGLAGREAVVALEPDGASARAYPVRYLMWHEIANDTVGDVPVAVTFCPLCNTAIVFDRRTDAGVLEFGVSGLLRFSDMIMFDRQTESWWQQATGDAIVGELTGAKLRQLPAFLESWDSFVARNPEGLVMDEPAAARAYGTNPYEGYDSSFRPFLYSGDPVPHDIPAMARVIAVGERAWTLERLRDAGRIAEAGVVLTWEAGQASALDTRDLGAGKEVGNVRVRDADGADMVHAVMFAFAFDAFHPDGEWMLAD
ncbi:DUF3179 domain-containing protein [Loktanella sp. SALINAS62]|uniref:DUF3179 domain-containing protein n=1 Tax=Loktanella sp. SALINAS62 TaxID=2706124 RepID=UPI001B8ACFDD|nr:DUF3179 domain-containing protein [Loktanella sp. SALINAS62]MBS1303572.1 DUF3179 domain-containing protein [Loktanella sp. SALINAS62]